MQSPLQITFRHMAPSSTVTERIREYVARLERFHDNVIGCHVVVDAPAAHRNKGAPFEVHIEATLPGKELFVRSNHADSSAHADVYVALRDAFDDMKRAMREYENSRNAAAGRLGT